MGTLGWCGASARHLAPKARAAFLYPSDQPCLVPWQQHRRDQRHRGGVGLQKQQGSGSAPSARCAEPCTPLAAQLGVPDTSTQDKYTATAASTQQFQKTQVAFLCPLPGGHKETLRVPKGRTATALATRSLGSIISLQICCLHPGNVNVEVMILQLCSHPAFVLCRKMSPENLCK